MHLSLQEFFGIAGRMCRILANYVGKNVPAGTTSLEFCAAQCMLLQCGSEGLSPVTVALLGRFLPRLGPLPQGERPFFFQCLRRPLLGRGAIRPQLLDPDLGQPVG